MWCLAPSPFPFQQPEHFPLFCVQPLLFVAHALFVVAVFVSRGLYLSYSQVRALALSRFHISFLFLLLPDSLDLPVLSNLAIDSRRESLWLASQAAASAVATSSKMSFTAVVVSSSSCKRGCLPWDRWYVHDSAHRHRPILQQRITTSSAAGHRLLHSPVQQTHLSLPPPPPQSLYSQFRLKQCAHAISAVRDAWLVG